ncbi:hypothetical protein M441DRAFT_150641 [Trichoderma asperellum CBS 433.97]|uniref:NB-ARC domain-containing protein n=1 Tax=Trichoderma asperellum (strain ATCC 204424 / CBS 433.97 / NBRC 101777) TaxID=1042311 RepID=A0A2T3YVM7_TRIA4|nr:hypothetical protein M441DRAFT_150641 [Trichoderma asperellum CBS 433.97]PTB36570.1 hypothetical protein M441DRAFT_150641 [Trichoderma asperellum CBS 433.97]
MEGPSRSSATLRSEAGPTRETFSGDQDPGFSAEIPDTQWQWIELLLETRDTPISDEDRRRLELELTADTCKNYIDILETKYGKKGGNKFIKAFEPVIEGLKAYTDGLNTLTKNSAGLSITWGVIQLLLECAMHSYKILGHITKLLESYTYSLKLYMEYAKDFIGHPRLDEALIINFFRGLFWGGKDSRDMEKVMEDLKQCFKIVKKEVSYAKHQRDHAMHRDIQAMAAIQGPSKWYMMQEHKGWPEAKMLPTDRRLEYHSRGGEVKQVEHHLNAEKAMSDCDVRVCIIHGMPGVGKTQLALHIACRWEGPVFWLNAETRVNLKESLGEIATILRLDVEPGMHGQEPSNLAKQWLATHNGWLLVYDNADNFEAMADLYWPTLAPLFIWSIDHRQDPKNLQSWPYERLPREVLDVVSYSGGGHCIVSSRLGVYG